MIQPEEAAELGSPFGVIVESMMEGSTAATAGMQVGDIVYECDGIAINNLEKLSDIVLEKDIGESVIMSVWREGETYDLEVFIGDINLMD